MKSEKYKLPLYGSDYTQKYYIVFFIVHFSLFIF